MMECCIQLSGITCQQHLQSASCHQLSIPRHRRLMFGGPSFTVAVPMTWNLLTDTVIQRVHLTVSVVIEKLFLSLLAYTPY